MKKDNGMAVALFQIDMFVLMETLHKIMTSVLGTKLGNSGGI